MSKAVLWCLLDEWSSGERVAVKDGDDVTLITGPRVFLELKVGLMRVRQEEK